MSYERNFAPKLSLSTHLALTVLFLLAAGYEVYGQVSSVPFHEIESYRKDGGRGDLWRNVVVSPKITREQITTLARDLHRAAPDARIRILSDDKEFQAFKLRDQNYPNPAYKYPEKWARKHYLAIINFMGGAGGGRWELYPTEKAGFKLIGESVPLD